MAKCNQISTKKRKFIYTDEECGCNASVNIEYILNNRKVQKNLCKRHFKSNVSWLEKIQVPFLKREICQCDIHKNKKQEFDFDLICSICNNLIVYDKHN
jgi:hypothetical protein